MNRKGTAPAPGMPLFSLHAAEVRFGQVQALAATTLEIRAGERVALIGANGSGKSSLLRMLHGLVPHASGVFVSRVPRRARPGRQAG